MGNESATHEQLADVVGNYDHAHTKLAVRRSQGGWQLDHAYITLNSPSKAPRARTWRYPAHQFLERVLPGHLLAQFLGGAPLQVDGIEIVPVESVSNALFQWLPSHRSWSPVTLPWPVTEWAISRVGGSSDSDTGPLIGDGPSFLTADMAFAAFMYDATPETRSLDRTALWRVHEIHPEAYLHRVTVNPDSLIVDVRGSNTAGSTLQLSSRTTEATRAVGTRRRLRFPQPEGIADCSLLVLRRGDDLLDFRYLTYPAPGRVADLSVEWAEPGVGLQLLINAGEGSQVEFKRHLPEGNTNEARRTMLKTVAAFASGDGGTILFGIDDDGTVVGLDQDTIEQQRERVVSMIRDLVTPAPACDIHIEAVDGHLVIALHIPSGPRGGYALFPEKPEFYVRRGATTFRARTDDIAAAYGRS